VLETLGPWCLPDKKLVVPREKLERQRLKILFFSPLMTTVEEVYLKNYIYREPINILEELNNQIHETLATVIPNVLRLARENLIKRARLFLQMKGGQFEHIL
jgi:DNA-binding MarR family transcriptional regulator